MTPSEGDPQWYKKVWTLDMQDLSWVEPTAHEVDFLIKALGLRGGERVLDLACGFGRHALELARRGYSVVGVDITPAFIDTSRKTASQEGLEAEFLCADLRDVSFDAEFDVVLNLADGAIGYLENDQENLKVFDRIASALKVGGQHLMSVCNGAYARKHFPRRHWDLGTHCLSLADFAWDQKTSRMLYTAHSFKYGQPLTRPQGEGSVSSIRLYTVAELQEILQTRGMHIQQTYGGYDLSTRASEDCLSLLVRSRKTEGGTAPRSKA